VRVPRGTTLVLPKNQTYHVPEDTRLGEVAQRVLGNRLRAPLLYDLNTAKLAMPQTLPPGATLRLPQHEWPALVAFGLLAGVLGLVGLGRGIKTT
jgi:hypothetical protein